MIEIMFLLQRYENGCCFYSITQMRKTIRKITIARVYLRTIQLDTVTYWQLFTKFYNECSVYLCWLSNFLEKSPRVNFKLILWNFVNISLKSQVVTKLVLKFGVNEFYKKFWMLLTV